MPIRANGRPVQFGSPEPLDLWSYDDYNLPMSTHSVADAKAHLSNLIDRAMDGEAVIITRHGRPVVEIKPVTKIAKPMSKADLEDLMNNRVMPLKTGWSSADLIRQMRDDGF